MLRKVLNPLPVFFTYPAATRCGGSLGHPGWGSASKSFCQVSPGILFECDFFPAAVVLQVACSGPLYASRLLSSCPRCHWSLACMRSVHRQQWTLPASTTGFHCLRNLRWSAPMSRCAAVPRACSRAARCRGQCGVPASTTMGHRGVAQILYSVMRYHLWGLCVGVLIRGAFMPGYQCGGKSVGCCVPLYCRACAVCWRRIVAAVSGVGFGAGYCRGHLLLGVFCRGIYPGVLLPGRSSG